MTLLRGVSLYVYSYNSFEKAVLQIFLPGHAYIDNYETVAMATIISHFGFFCQNSKFDIISFKYPLIVFL